MSVQKERKSTFLTAFEQRKKKACNLFAAQYWYRSWYRRSQYRNIDIDIFVIWELSILKLSDNVCCIAF